MMTNKNKEEKDNYKLTKNHSMAIHGLAILLMLYHHLFSYADSYSNVYFFNVNFSIRAAWFCKICVGLYAFAGGYGMFHVFGRETKGKLPERTGGCYKSVLKRIIKLFLKLWFVMWSFIIIDELFIHTGYDLSLKSILGNMTAVNPTFSGIWWYARQYAIMMAILPVVHIYFEGYRFFENKRNTVLFYVVSTIVLGTLGLVFIIKFRPAVIYMQPLFTLVFFAGYFLARYDIYDLADRLFDKVSVKLKTVIALLMIVGAVCWRVLYASDPAWATFDFIIVPMFVYGFIGIVGLIKPVLHFFEFVGKYSTYMWLSHGFIYAYLLVPLCNICRYSFLIFIAMSVITLCVAAVFMLFQKYAMILFGKVFSRKVQQKIL